MISKCQMPFFFGLFKFVYIFLWHATNTFFHKKKRQTTKLNTNIVETLSQPVQQLVLHKLQTKLKARSSWLDWRCLWQRVAHAKMHFGENRCVCWCVCLCMWERFWKMCLFFLNEGFFRWSHMGRCGNYSCFYFVPCLLVLHWSMPELMILNCFIEFMKELNISLKKTWKTVGWGGGAQISLPQWKVI